MGDINGDGHSDLLLGDEDFETVSCHLGGPTGVSSDLWWSSAAPISLIAGVGSLGDVDGDRHADLLAPGAFESTSGEPLSPQLMLGSIQGLVPSESPALSAAVPSHSVSFEDVDCDGTSDIVLGTQREQGIGRSVADVYRWSRAAGAVEFVSSVHGLGIPKWPIDPAVPVGDVDGDGCGDVMVLGFQSNGDPTLDRVNSALLFLGSADGLRPEATWIAGNGKLGIERVTGVTRVGDVDGDGREDVLLQVWALEANRHVYRLVVFTGTSSGLSQEPAWSWPVDDHLVRPIESADVNGDGRRDLFLLQDGEVLLYLAQAGSPPGPFGGAKPVFDFVEGSDLAVADVTGDGCSDFAVVNGSGAILYAGGHPD